MRIGVALGVVLGVLMSAVAQAESLSCLIQPYQEADIGSQVIGVLDRILVERGDFVKKGQAIALLSSDVERAQAASAKLRAEATADLKAASSNNDFAQKKKVRTVDLVKKNFVSQQASEQAVTEAQVAEMKLRQAREQQLLAQQELMLAQAQVAQRTIKSPLSGVVSERYLSEGERVEDKPVMRVASIDPLRVEVIVPASYFNKIKQGMSASVRPELADAEVRSAKVIVVDRVIDAASNSFRVRLELPNPNYQLPPGLRCKIDFELAGMPADNAQSKLRPSAGAPKARALEPQALKTRPSVAVAPLK